VAYWHFDHHLLTAWSHGWMVQLAGGLISIYPERAKLSLASALQRL
jgi:hypothetical protein